jgi:hypothetical protein
MDTLNGLIDAAQRNCDPATVEELRTRLGVSRQAVYDWKKGTKAIGDEHLARLIELAAADPAIALSVRQEAAKSDHERHLWRSLSRRLLTAAALFVALTGTIPTQASERIAPLCEVMRRRLKSGHRAAVPA